ncbi:hypothetical protein INT47_012435 [Mucor saturninus]|uniref:RRM domain-containing protein n=1 Tax=Mucor saturninus TaxID=64648 RepID=A0A8H7V3L8_9FUNG|nr:hypothetical protein INT47_012435 [Mucor saturninus]
MWYSKEYDPIQVGSIDGTDIHPHDAAIARATRSTYRPPKHLKTDPKCTLFISRLNFDTTELTLKPFFEKYGTVTTVELIRNNVTGLSQGYAFITFADTASCREAYKYAHETVLDDHVILVDYERSRTMRNWIPRRLGGGYGGKKESGQLRFGARDRPFRDPYGKLRIDYDQKRSDNWRTTTDGSNEHRRDSKNCKERDNEHHIGKDSERHREVRPSEHRRERSSERRRERSSERHRERSSERCRERSSERRREGPSKRSSEHRRQSDRGSPEHKKKRIDRYR